MLKTFELFMQWGTVSNIECLMFKGGLSPATGGILSTVRSATSTGGCKYSGGLLVILQVVQQGTADHTSIGRVCIGWTVCNIGSCLCGGGTVINLGGCLYGGDCYQLWGLFVWWGLLSRLRVVCVVGLFYTSGVVCVMGDYYQDWGLFAWWGLLSTLGLLVWPVTITFIHQCSFLWPLSQMHSTDWTVCEVQFPIHECSFRILKVSLGPWSIHGVTTVGMETKTHFKSFSFRFINKRF